jgi:hypothetical protein
MRSIERMDARLDSEFGSDPLLGCRGRKCKLRTNYPPRIMPTFKPMNWSQVIFATSIVVCTCAVDSVSTIGAIPKDSLVKTISRP